MLQIDVLIGIMPESTGQNGKTALQATREDDGEVSTYFLRP